MPQTRLALILRKQLLMLQRLLQAKTNYYVTHHARLFTRMKKSQIQMTETIMILFIFLTLVLFAALFYVRIAHSKADVKQEENLQLKAVEMSQKASFLPEIQCSEGNIVIDNCVDLLKLDVAKTIMAENRIFYYDKFEFSTIKIMEMYPDEQEWIIYNNSLTNYKDKKATFLPTSVFDPQTKAYSFGVLVVEIYK